MEGEPNEVLPKQKGGGGGVVKDFSHVEGEGGHTKF